MGEYEPCKHGRRKGQKGSFGPKTPQLMIELLGVEEIGVYFLMKDVKLMFNEDLRQDWSIFTLT